ncbi:MAG: hypothetical protein JWQ32_2223 [Marmoricola sp.]|nr:hypothetical protein [Marmoricola sp.]
MTVETRRARNRHGPLAAPYVPGPRVSTENDVQVHRHRAPTLGELISDAMLIIRRDELPPSGYLVVQQSKGTAKHQHAVWELGPFALLDDGWFGQAHGRDSTGDKRMRWLRRHERKCSDQHWTQFNWIDPALLGSGCGADNIGLALSPDGPVYCAGQVAGGREHPEHVPLEQLLRAGLRELARKRTA